MKNSYKNTKKPLWIFLHLPKTGGTTFQGNIARHLKFDEAFLNFSSWGDKYRFTNKLLPFNKRDHKEKEKAVFLGGHRIFYGIHHELKKREPRYITFLRDPASRCVSLYNFKKSGGNINLNFTEWYKKYLSANKNAMVRFYAHRLINIKFKNITEKEFLIAKKMIDLCWFVGITEKLDSHLGFLFEQIGISNKTWRNHRIAGKKENAVKNLNHFHKKKEYIKKFITLDENLRKKINLDNALDFELYQYAVEKNNIMVEKYQLKNNR